ncbi:sugar ABC transporter substrate-binding protein [Paraburkholderia terricola]|uniref:Ribose transport system substrate-binding protein n=1 Tax=Paraburkholderia terricola TaxID=169427 RepID=A0A1M6J2G7_9BURK|nr:MULTISPECIES: sugar ABC transporter substrate-binding protein [Paraburkholderia]SDN48586.1 ribose transport system substrate-binding protein [Paraburkholderia sediminicola]SHJ40832.1 ribose transport system substrate-binding protein [Paraburkholderia terricola]
MSTELYQKVTPDHLRRDAFLYVRQSSLRQVFENTESTKRQYALRERGAPGMAQNWQRTKGFKAGLDESGAKYRIVASQPTDLTPEQGESVCQNILTAHPDVDLFYNQADDLVIGCAKAVRAAGSHAKLVGWGGSHLGINAIKAGDVDGTVCVEPEKMGRLAFKALYAAVMKPETPKGKFVEVDTPPVTKANVSSCVPQW